MSIKKAFMKQIQTLLVILIFSILSCGGSGGGSNVDYAGRWIGQVQLDQKRSCVPPSDQFVDLSNKEYTFTVSDLDEENYLRVVDQEGKIYEQFFPNGIHNGEFSVNAIEQNLNFQPPTGATSIYFPPNDGESVDGEVYVFYNRFCTVYFVGNFRKINIG